MSRRRMSSASKLRKLKRQVLKNNVNNNSNITEIVKRLRTFKTLKVGEWKVEKRKEEILLTKNGIQLVYVKDTKDVLRLKLEKVTNIHVNTDVNYAERIPNKNKKIDVQNEFLLHEKIEAVYRQTNKLIEEDIVNATDDIIDNAKWKGLVLELHQNDEFKVVKKNNNRLNNSYNVYRMLPHLNLTLEVSGEHLTVHTNIQDLSYTLDIDDLSMETLVRYITNTLVVIEEHHKNRSNNSYTSTIYFLNTIKKEMKFKHFNELNNVISEVFYNYHIKHKVELVIFNQLNVVNRKGEVAITVSVEDLNAEYHTKYNNRDKWANDFRKLYTQFDVEHSQHYIA